MFGDNNPIDQIAQAKAQLAAGGALMTTPLWLLIGLQYIGIIASAVAAICGAIIGVHAVWRLWKRRGA